MSFVSLVLEEMGHVVDDMTPYEPPRKRRSVEASMPCDVSEDNEKLVIETELAGVPKDKISVTIEKDALIIEATKEECRAGDPSIKKHTKEIRRGQLRRSFKLPSGAQTDTPRCSFSDGVLRIEIPRQSSSRARKLEIL